MAMGEVLFLVSSLLLTREVYSVTTLSKEGPIQFGNFIKSEYGRAISKSGCRISNVTTTNQDDCLRECIGHENCLSINLVRSDQPNVLHCELLSWAGTDFSRYLEPRARSYSMQLVTKCLPNPCLNGGECAATMTSGHQQYSCNCTVQYGGKLCEHKCDVLFDFENGSLTGWTLTGTAFNNQPTYGDNPYIRDPSKRSNHKGNWWIGTFENRASPSQAAGATQGDVPTGTMTSPSFIIRGRALTFLIGGGPNIHVERVELLIEGVVIGKASSNASAEEMVTKTINVTSYRGQTAQIRIVDEGSSGWGHVNADHFENNQCGDV